jgi:hypothetical protein
MEDFGRSGPAGGDPWSLEGAARRGDGLPGGDRGRGSGASDGGDRSRQARKNIHLLCDMLGGPAGEAPAAARPRKRLDDRMPDAAMPMQRQRLV